MVDMNVVLKASSENLNRTQVFPTPESPMSSNLNSKSYVFLAMTDSEHCVGFQIEGECTRLSFAGKNHSLLQSVLDVSNTVFTFSFLLNIFTFLVIAFLENLCRYLFWNIFFSNWVWRHSWLIMRCCKVQIPHPFFYNRNIATNEMEYV